MISKILDDNQSMCYVGQYFVLFHKIFDITMFLLIPQYIGLLREDISAFIVKDSKDKKIAA